MSSNEQNTGQTSVTFGQRAADRSVSIFGSWKFLAAFALFTCLWCAANLTIWTFDRYPFLFFSLGLNILSIILSALILLSGNRQAAEDREEAQAAYVQVHESADREKAMLEEIASLKEQMATMQTVLTEAVDLLHGAHCAQRP